MLFNFHHAVLPYHLVAVTLVPFFGCLLPPVNVSLSGTHTVLIGMLFAIWRHGNDA